jgi:hypothetical protein
LSKPETKVSKHSPSKVKVIGVMQCGQIPVSCLCNMRNGISIFSRHSGQGTVMKR